MRALLALLLLSSAPPDAGLTRQAISVPTRLSIVRSATALRVWVDAPREQVLVDVTPGLVLGVQSQLVVDAEATSKPRVGRAGLSGGTDFNLGTSTFNRSQDGLPVPGAHYVVGLRVSVFETDRPVGHLWSPESPRYRVLWTRTIEQRVE